jgi:XTP/dITP diphosphohydrolase
MTTHSRRLVLASGNRGKLAEIRKMLAERDFELVAQTALGVPAAEETGRTFVENALLKARNACAHTGLPAIADDSGLVVDALGGRPGVHSARFAGPAATDTDNVLKLLAELAGVANEARTARFYCVMVAMRDADDPAPLVAEGIWRGRIAAEPRGGGGFGYDPVFLADGGRTAAELGDDEKNRLSHRGTALRRLVESLTAEWLTGI